MSRDNQAPPVLVPPEKPLAQRKVPQDLAERIAREYGAGVAKGARVSVWRRGVMATAQPLPWSDAKRMGHRMVMRQQAFARAAQKRGGEP